MLLTWHYMDYYSNAYAVNQYLASRGFTVLSVNYRTGIGYGHDFNFPPQWGPTGASEYQDVVAGARFLQRQSNVDAKRIGMMSAVVATHTTTLRFITSIYVLPMHELFGAAKAISTAAFVSGNRVTLGVGAGWMKDEFLLTGQDFHTGAGGPTRC